MDRQKTPLQKLRAARGYTQIEIATAVGMDQATYSNIENGINAARPANAAKIVKFFGADIISEMHIIFPKRYPHFKVLDRV